MNATFVEVLLYECLRSMALLPPMLSDSVSFKTICKARGGGGGGGKGGTIQFRGGLVTTRAITAFQGPP